MNDQTIKIVSASVSDRGLSQKRPLNEDSFLADVERRIFAVADGVGGAQAGEVASQTAVEVLDEAFRHHDPSVDVEDLMELAIQRANSSIYRMAQEHPKLQMMATTIVALHLKGNVATIGHVGDSRLYRVTPDGDLHRDTRDHSVVEEEVRAGRMTPAQAANHPSRNVISRALGAEEGVEVDMTTIDVQDGTTFLLCSDGITRHLPDDELLTLLNRDEELDATCEEMKRLCYERGAEDNLTAVIVRVGDRASIPAVTAPDKVHATLRSDNVLVATMSGESQIVDPALHETVDALRPLSPLATNAKTAEDRQPVQSPAVVAAQTLPSSAPVQGSSFGTFARTLLALILILGVAAAAFFGGMYKQRRDQQAATDQEAEKHVTPLVAPQSEFERKRHEVDGSPSAMAARMAHDQVDQPLTSSDPEFLYLYGRALLLSGKYTEASAAFAKVTELVKARPQRDPLRIENRIAATVAAVKSGNAREREKAAAAFDEVIDLNAKAVAASSGSGNSKKFPKGANSSVTSPVGLTH